LLQEIIGVKIANRRENLEKQTENHFLFIEHPHVYTLGKSGDLSIFLEKVPTKYQTIKKQ